MQLKIPSENFQIAVECGDYSFSTMQCDNQNDV